MSMVEGVSAPIAGASFGVDAAGGSGMLSARASIRVASLSVHGTMPAGEKVLDRGSVFMVISCAGEDGPAR